MSSRIYNTARRGLACVAYPCIEAMRRPEVWDTHGGRNLTPFYVSKYQIEIFKIQNY